jgi:hypothetical protein
MKTLLRVAPILLVTACWVLDRPFAAEAANEQQDRQQVGAFTGLYRNESRNGRPETVRVTDGKIYIDISEQEYRDRGYAPPFESLWTRIVRRLPVQPPVPGDRPAE